MLKRNNNFQFHFLNILLLIGVSFMRGTSEQQTRKIVALSRQGESSKISVEKAIKERRSVRSYKHESLTLQELSQLLWAAQGITDEKRGLRASPSAGALYPLEIYVVVGQVEGLPAAVYKYVIGKNELIKVGDGDKRARLSSAALSQSCVAAAPASIVVCAVYERTSRKYGQRAQRYVHMEVGAVAENIYLQGRAMQVGTVFIGAFDDESVKKVIGASPAENPLAILPLGKI
ncbi:SagB/ThcOx family dehydrogenase [Candidatus Dependentiae bacterium]|nr:MAG: SagB/ThcOx family dehydrogenase [Candidatus Dependentiae bacterium]